MTVKISKPAVNLREELNELKKPTGVAGEAMLRAETPQEQFNLISAGRRNLLINGDFRVGQRGNYTSATAVTTNNYYLDRWNLDFSGVSATIQNNSTDLPNGITAKTAKVAATSTGGAGYIQIRQRIEVESWMDNRTVTVSSWVKSNTAYPRLRIEGAAPTTNQDSTHIYSGSGNWEFLTMTLTLRDAISVFSVGVILWNSGTVAISSGDYVEISQFQVELGKVATPFEHRSYGEELALCQRYFRRMGNNDGTNTHLMSGGVEGSATFVVSMVNPTTMRAVPTVTIGSGVLAYSASSGSVTINSFASRCSRDVACISATVGGTSTLGQSAVLFGAGTNGHIDLNAEL